MSEQKRRFVDLSPLRASPAFARLWVGAALAGIGAQLTIVAVGLIIFDITKSTLAVGLVGGIALIPMLFAGPWGGMLADSFDRRNVLLVSLSVGWLSTLGLVLLTFIDASLMQTGERVAVWPFYLFTTINAMSYIITGASRTASYPRLVSTELVPRATALNGISMGVQYTVGPALAGILVATVGFSATFAVDVVLASAAFLGVLTMPKLAPLSENVARGWTGIKEGLVFLRSAPVIRTSFYVDIIAMSLGRPFALMPAVAATVIGGGPTTVGILTASAAVGTFLTSLLSGPVARVNRYGIAIGRAVMIYGAFVAAFGLLILAGTLGAFGEVTEAWSGVNGVGLVLGVLLLLGMGASDEVSAIFRSTLLLISAPDEMRGRLQGVFYSVVAGGPRLGDLYVGLLATALALWAPPLIGGMLIIVFVALILRARAAFRDFDRSAITD